MNSKEYYQNYYLRNKAKKAEQLKERRKKSPLKFMAKEGKRNKENPKANQERVRNWRNTTRGKELRKLQYEKNKVKDNARKILRKAVLGGIMEKGRCAICGSDNTQGHHEDYDKPLDVIWLCDEHHKVFEKVKRILNYRLHPERKALDEKKVRKVLLQARKDWENDEHHLNGEMYQLSAEAKAICQTFSAPRVEVSVDKIKEITKLYRRFSEDGYSGKHSCIEEAIKQELEK